MLEGYCVTKRKDFLVVGGLRREIKQLLIRKKTDQISETCKDNMIGCFTLLKFSCSMARYNKWELK